MPTPKCPHDHEEKHRQAALKGARGAPKKSSAAPHKKVGHVDPDRNLEAYSRTLPPNQYVTHEGDVVQFRELTAREKQEIKAESDPKVLAKRRRMLEAIEEHKKEEAAKRRAAAAAKRRRK